MPSKVLLLHLKETPAEVSKEDTGQRQEKLEVVVHTTVSAEEVT
jgi:hypothetical protein